MIVEVCDVVDDVDEADLVCCCDSAFESVFLVAVGIVVHQRSYRPV